MRSTRFIQACLMLLMAGAGCSEEPETAGVDVGPTDGSIADAAASDGAGADAGLAPVITFLEPEESSVEPGPVTLSVQISDDRDAPTTLIAHFASDLRGVLGQIAADTTGIASVTVTLDVGEHTVSVRVQDSDGLEGTATRLLRVLEPSAAPAVQIEPTMPRTTDTLTAVVGPTSSAANLSFRWERDGIASGITANSVPPSATAAGQTWVVYVADGDSPESSSSVVIQDSPPSCAKAVIAPPNPKTNTTMVCSCTEFADADSDLVTGACVWSVDGEPVFDASCTLPPGTAPRDASVACVLTPTTIAANGTPVSATVVVANSKPVPPQLAITPQAASVDQIIRCTTLTPASDPNDDSLTETVTWIVDGADVPDVHEVEVSAHLIAARDQSVQCRVDVTDGDLDASATSATIVLNGAKPTVEDAVIEPALPNELTELSCVPVGAADLDGDVIQWAWSWHVNGEPGAGNQQVLTGTAFDKGDSVFCIAFPSDVDGAGSPAQSAPVVIGNVLPSLESASVAPEEAPRTGTFTCEWTGWTDPDPADEPAVSIEWLANGEVIPGANGTSLAGTGLIPGAEVTCRVTPRNGDELGAPILSTGATVTNQPPMLLGVTITPKPATTGDLLGCNPLGGIDEDNDPLGYSFEWLVNDVPVSSQKHLAPGTAVRGDSVVCRATPTDGFDSGPPVASSPVIIDNSAPILATVNLTPTAGGLSTTWTCAHDGVDPDGDMLEPTWSWFVDDVPISEQSATYDGTGLVPGATLHCAASVSDGEDSSPTVASNAVPVTNQPPRIQSVSLTQLASGDARCTPVGWFDADGDPPTYDIRWFVAGKQVPGQAGLELAATWFDVGQTVICEATPIDPATTGPPKSSAPLVVLNARPHVAALTITSPATTDGPVVCDVTLVDAEADPIVVMWTTTVDGEPVTPVVDENIATIAGPFALGSTVSCRVSGSDLGGSGPAVTVETTVLNRPPELVAAALVPSTPTRAEPVSCLAQGAHDPDGQDLTTEFQWLRAGAVISSDATLPPSAFVRGELLTCRTRVSDGTLTSPWRAASAVVADAPPAATATISPTTGRPDTTFDCTIQASDPDGDAVTTTITWWLDDVPLALAPSSPLLGSSLAEFATAGQSLTCRATPQNTLVGATAVSAPVVLTNAAPTLVGAGFDPVVPTAAMPLRCVPVGYADPDNDPADIHYAWFIDDAPLETTQATLPAGALTRGQLVRCDATAHDGFSAGNTVSTGAVPVANSRPAVVGVAVAPAGGSETPESNFSCLLGGAYDADGDSITSTFAWFLGEAPVGAGPAWSGVLSEGQILRCEATPHDGFEAGETVSSPGLVGGNLPPSLTSVSIAPAAPDSGTTLSCAAFGFSDPEGASEAWAFEWTVNGVPVLSDGATLSSAAFQRGDTVSCFARPDDGVQLGAGALATVIIGNAPPGVATATIASLSGEAITALTPLVCLAGGLSDADGDATTTQVEWRRGEVLLGSGSPWTPVNVAANDTIRCVITPTDALGASGESVQSPAVTLGNAPPSLTAAIIVPNSGGDAICAVTANDPDGGTVDVTRAWTVDGLPAGELETLAASAFSKGQLLRCSVTAEDSAGATASRVATHLVVNRPPKVAVVTLDPAPPSARDQPSCLTLGYTDPDGDPLVSWTFLWTLDGDPVGVDETLASPIARGQTIRCGATPFDGQSDGAMVWSPAFTVANAAPHLADVAITPALPAPGDTLTCEPIGFDDPDGDPPLVHLAWTVDGEPAGDGATLIAPEKGASVTCTATPADPFTSGPPASTTTIVTNGAPTVSGARIYPLAPTVTSVLSCEALDFVDPDGDPPINSVLWLVNGLVAGNDPTLDAAALQEGDDVVCRLTPGDGASIAPPVQSPVVTIGDSPPTVGEVLITPAPGTVCSPLTCEAVDVFDPDQGDLLTISYAWTVDDAPAGSGSTLNAPFEPGATIVCTATVQTDGAGVQKSSEPVVITNAAPQVDVVHLVPDVPVRGVGLHCSPTAFEDPDCPQIPAYTFEWLVNDAPIDFTGEVLATEDLPLGTLVQCIATPNDGYLSGEPVASPVRLLTCSATLCSDDDPCTVDSCDVPAATCVHTAMDCDDGNLCTEDTCEAGTCVATPVPCDDEDPCTVDSCADGVCGYAPVSCDDNNPCTLDVCKEGECTHVEGVCSDGDACTVDRCNPGKPLAPCTFVPLGDPCGTPCGTAAACDDGDPCTVDACEGGICTNTPLACDDGDSCTLDYCDPVTVSCLHQVYPVCGNACIDASACDDNDPCTDDICDATFFACTNVPQPGCLACTSDLDCTEPPWGADRCVVGQCTDNVCVFTPRVCHDGISCTDDLCEPSSGCEFRVLRECERGCVTDSDCDDDHPCTERLCDDGVCSGQPIDCDDDDPCTFDYCAPTTGVCTHLPDPTCASNPPCATDLDCDLGDACLIASCTGPEDDRECFYEVRACNDYDSCTIDGCDPQTGCTATPVNDQCTPGSCQLATDCQDGDSCTTNACVDGQCAASCTVHGDCHDGNPQTLDSCVDGACRYAEGAPCSADYECWDDNACTKNFCDGDTCRARALRCDDHRGVTRDFAPCTAAIDSIETTLQPGACADSSGFAPACDPELGCLDLPVLNVGSAWLPSDPTITIACSTDADCATGHPCAPGFCDAGTCAVDLVQCPDPGPNKRAFCDYETGTCEVQDWPSWTGCVTDDDCRITLDGLDACSLAFCDVASEAGTCVTFAKPCDDQNPCTTDACDPDGPGCTHEPIPGCSGCTTDADCDDRDSCSVDSCVGGQCEYTALPGCKSCVDPICVIEDGQLTCSCTPPPAPVCPADYCQTDADCNDGSSCTLDHCLPNGECTSRPVECLFETAGCRFFAGVCREGFGCEAFPNPECDRPCESAGDCETGSPCFPSACVEGRCEVEPVVCNDEDPCTIDVCLDDSGACEHKPAPDCTPCASDEECPDVLTDSCGAPRCLDGTCFQTVIACDDHDPCTTDVCTPTGCEFVPIDACGGCQSDTDCSDGNACTENLCVDGGCEFPFIEGCLPCFTDTDCPVVEGDPCRPVYCEVISGTCVQGDLGNTCVSCDPNLGPNANAVVCDDGLTCTADSCSAMTQTCVHEYDETIPGCQLKPCDGSLECQGGGACVVEYCDFSDPNKSVCRTRPLAKSVAGLCPLDCETDSECRDADPCTVDRCDPLEGICTWTAKDCVDGLPCTLDHHCTTAGCEFLPDPTCSGPCTTDADCSAESPCLAGTCDAGQCTTVGLDCDDANPCTQDFCNEGLCQHKFVSPCETPACTADADCASLSGAACELTRCLDGQCAILPRSCDDSSPCTNDACEDGIGCVFAPVPGCSLGCTSPADCDDDDTNTIDSCEGGVCRNEFQGPACSADRDCWDANACTYEFCNPTGHCESIPVLCFDGLECTKDLAPCGGVPSDISSETAYQTCDPTLGQPVACDPAAGCYFLPSEVCGNGIDGVHCNTDADCATNHACWPSACINGICLTDIITCPLETDKQTFCAPETGQCTAVDSPDWKDCVTHQDCRHVPDDPIAGFHKCEIGFCNTVGDTTEEAQCRYFERNCNDLNPCTVDTCDPAVGCVFTPIPGCLGCSSKGDCNDYNPCTTDSCVDSQCEHTKLPNCSACTVGTQDVHCFDGDECTRDLCDESAAEAVNEAGKCVHVPYTAEERPGCFTSCSSDRDCGDGDPCTIDRCDPDTSLCTNEPPTCRDGLACTPDALLCDAQYPGCPAGVDTSCDNDSCSDDADCFIPNACIQGSCNGGSCSFQVTFCDDGDPSTRDRCHPATGACFNDTVPGGWTGCDETPQGVDSEPCDDGDACTRDTCTAFNGGFCFYQAVACNDFDPCTTDSCEPESGCIFEPIVGCTGCQSDTDCDDGDFCTADRCGSAGVGPGDCAHVPHAELSLPTPAGCQ